jgi:hypothetical protein
MRGDPLPSGPGHEKTSSGYGDEALSGIDVQSLERLSAVEVWDLLVLTCLLTKGRKVRELADFLNEKDHRIQYTLDELNGRFEEIIHRDVVNSRQDGNAKSYELTPVGENVARWALEHLRLFNLQLAEFRKNAGAVIRIASVHFMLHIAARLRDRLEHEFSGLDARVVPIHSRHVLNRISFDVTDCDCYLAPLLERGGQRRHAAEGFSFESLGQEEIKALVNEALATQLQTKELSGEDISRWLAFKPGPGLIRAWMKEVLGESAYAAVLNKKLEIRDSIHQIHMLRSQKLPGLMLVSSGIADWAAGEQAPPSYLSKLQPREGLRQVTLSPPLREVRVVVGALYRQHEVQSSAVLKALLAEFPKIRAEADSSSEVASQTAMPPGRRIQKKRTAR